MVRSDGVSGRDRAGDGIGFVPNGLSRWMARRQRVFIAMLFVSGLLGLIVLGGTIVGLLSGSGGTGRIVWMFVAPMISLMGAGFASVLWMRATHRQRRAVEEASGHACPNCLYDLSADAVSRCPECGQRVEYDALPVLWAGTRVRGGLGSGVDPETGFGDAGLSAWEIAMRRWGWALALLIPVVSFGPWQLVFHGLGSRSLGARAGLGALATVVAMVALLGPVFVLLFRKKKLLERVLRATGGLACPACLHDLSGASVGACPECGQRVDYAMLAPSWRVRMRVLGIPGPEDGGEDGAVVVTDAPARPAASES